MLIGTILITLSGIQCAVLVAYLLWLASSGTSRDSGHDVPNREEMKKHILWKSFYVNPNDPRGWVPKTWGYGWTVNFRTRQRALIFAVMIIDCLLFALIGSALLLWA